MVPSPSITEMQERRVEKKGVAYEALPPADGKCYDVVAAAFPRPVNAAKKPLESWTFSCAANELQKAEQELAQDPDCKALMDTVSQEFPRASRHDILMICHLYALLLIKNRDLEKLSRREEREVWVKEMQNVVKNFKSQGNWLLGSSVISAAFQFVSAGSIVTGHLFGTEILAGLSKVTSRFNGMKPDQAFEMVQKFTSSAADLNKASGQIQNTFAEGHRNRHQQLSEIGRMDSDEATRVMDEQNQDRRSVENWVERFLQTEHEAARSLYN